MPSYSVIDSHAHLNIKDFDKDRDDVIQEAFREGIRAILCPSDITDSRNVQIALELIDKYENIIAAAGVHPHNAKDFTPECIEKIEELCREKKIHAVGEIGLDFHYNFSSPADQKKAFREQLKAAQRLHLPVIIHSRKAAAEILRVVEEEHFTSGGVLHCFTEDWEFASRMINYNFFISFSGILTFPSAFLLREAAKKIPLDKLLVETDSPYLIPVPYRGKTKRNKPVFVKEIAQYLAALKDISVDRLAEATTKNFISLFLFEIKKLGC